MYCALEVDKDQAIIELVGREPVATHVHRDGLGVDRELKFEFESPVELWLAAQHFRLVRDSAVGITKFVVVAA